MTKYASVVVDLANSLVDKTFDYIVPQHMEVCVGCFCVVPFGGRKLDGVVLALNDTTNQPHEKLKEIIEVKDLPCVSPLLLQLANEMCEEFFLRKIDVLHQLVPSGIRTGKVKDKTINLLTLNENLDENLVSSKAKMQQSIVAYLKEKGFENQTTLSKIFSPSVVKTLLDKGVLHSSKQKIDRTPEKLNIKTKNISHTFEQKRAIDAVEMESSQTYLLHGVTGSGKTEVYMAVIDKVLAIGKTAIMLVPEISLTPQVVSNFKTRFGDDIALLHSGLSAGEKADEWNRMFDGKAKIVVGARSAIFAPLKNVGVIVIDEEHDQSYISESNPRYNTQKVALIRSKLENCPLILGSATPSIATYLMAKEGRAKLLELPVRVNHKPLPPLQIVDMLGEIRNGADLTFSNTLLRELKNVEKSKKQAMLLINRRGYSSFFQCKECGYVAKCTSCDVSLVYHKEDNTLRCHYCGKKFRALNKCPQCHSSYIKLGATGTEKVAEMLKSQFPNVEVLRMDNDTTSTKNAHQNILNKFSTTHPCFLVGTQMIAKGHDFPDVTLVGIVDADQTLFNSSYMASERTYQLLAQMAGRAGRSESEGLVILQTFCPKHYVFKFVANGDYKGFFEKECNVRKTTLFPPFSTILKIMIASEKEEQAKNCAKTVYEQMTLLEKDNKSEFYYLTATASPISKMQDKFRFQVIARIKNNKILISKVFELAEKNQKPNVSMFVEINPQSMQ